MTALYERTCARMITLQQICLTPSITEHNSKRHLLLARRHSVMPKTVVKIIKPYVRLGESAEELGLFKCPA
jgi:hypothetical protein